MIKSVQLDQGGFLVVSIGTSVDRYPYVWLRDNCQCEACFHPVSKTRKILFKDLDTEIQPQSAEVTEEGRCVRITWPDGHQSTFKEDWLSYRRFTKEDAEKRKPFHKRKPKLWDSKMENNIPRISYDKLFTDEGLHKWLVTLEEEGLCIVYDAPCELGVLKKIASRIAYLRKCNYGETFQVQSKVVPVSLAYTAGHLGFHTDSSYYDYTPGIQMLHCIAQVKTKGGDNIFVDGFNVIEKMKKEFPDYYKILTTVPVDICDTGKEEHEFHQLSRSLPITLDADGELDVIHYSGAARDSVFNVPLEQVLPFYRAYRKLEEMFNDSSNCIKYKMKDGDISCFNNQRVLHGRLEYTPTETGMRHLEGSYMDWDELRSMRRVLDQKLKIYTP